MLTYHGYGIVLFRYHAGRCQMSDYRSTEASTLMLKSLRKDFMPHGLFLVRVSSMIRDHALGAGQRLVSRHMCIPYHDSAVAGSFSV